MFIYHQPVEIFEGKPIYILSFLQHMNIPQQFLYLFLVHVLS